MKLEEILKKLLQNKPVVVLLIVLILAFTIWELYDSLVVKNGLDYFAAHPGDIVMGLVVVVLFIAAVWVFSRLPTRMQLVGAVVLCGLSILLVSGMALYVLLMSSRFAVIDVYFSRSWSDRWLALQRWQYVILVTTMIVLPTLASAYLLWRQLSKQRRKTVGKGQEDHL